MPDQKPVYRIIRERIRCPRCRSTRYTTHTTRPQLNRAGEVVPGGSVLRYHACQRCKFRFSSLDQ